MRKTLAQFCAGLLLVPILVGILLASTAVLAVDPGGSTSSTPDTTRYVEIETDTSTSTELKFGEEKRLTVKVYTKLGQNGTRRDVTREAIYRWYSSNTDAVSIPINTIGGVRGVGIGSSEITVEATYGGVTKDMKFTVNVVDNIRVIVTERTAAVETVNATVDTSKELYAYIVKNGAIEKGTITWSVPKADESVVQVTQNMDGSIATLAPKKVGTADITAAGTIAGGGTVEPAVVHCIVGPKPSTDPDDPGTSDPGTTLPEGAKITGITIDSPKPAGADGKYIMSPGSENIQVTVSANSPDNVPLSSRVQWNRSGKATASFIIGGKSYEAEVVFDSSDRNIVSVSAGRIIAGSAGPATITARVGDESTGTAKAELNVEVSGFVLLEDEVFLDENQSVGLIEGEILKAYGNADLSTLSAWSDNTTVATYENGRIIGRNPGKATFTVSANRGAWRDTFTVEVSADPNATIPGPGVTITISDTETLPFTDSRLESGFNKQAGGSLSHITGLNVDASKGTLYYKYNPDSQAGAGVGAGSYYLNPRSGQMGLSDITFVPKSGFAGDVDIYYTAVSTGGQNYACRIHLTVTTQSGNDAATTLRTNYNTPLKFTGAEFNRVCQERLGSRLSYVTFSQPPERQGTLYTNYLGAGNYGRVVSPSTHYTVKELDDVWFVPAPGFSGIVTVYYTAYGTGANAKSYAGQVNITVNPEDGVAIGGLAFDTSRGGVARFDDERFNTYCREVLHEDSWSSRQTLSHIRFDALPSADEGVLYYDYRSASSTGSRAAVGTSYYYGTRTPRIDRLTFVPASGYVGTVKIPFTGWTSDGTRFTGNVEVNVRGGTGTGDIVYVCAPGRTVSFRSSDFSALSNTLTGRTIDYIVFRGLPNSSDGSLYYNSSRISTTGSQYRNSNIGRLSFRASNSFSGAVDIPFEGRSANGEFFNGVVTISTSSTGSTTGWGNIQYSTRVNTAVIFDEYDFDDLSRWETDRDISSVRFDIPRSSQGSLYRNYRSSSSQGTRITSNTSISASELDRVAFIPADGYTGTVYIDFRATAAGSGGSFDGTVEITVSSGYSAGSGSAYFSDMNGYSQAQQTAVDFLYEHDITRGLSVGQYGPESHIRRGDFARMVYQAFGMSPSYNPNAFYDVPSGIYYAEAVNTLAARGVVSGTGGGYFSPDSALTRQDAICMIQRAMRAVGREAGDGSFSALSGYSDAGSVSGYAQGAMSFAVQRGYLPITDGRLSPTQPLTRVHMAEIIYRVLTS